MSTDGEWEEEMTTVAFRLRADGYWEAKAVGAPNAEVFTSRSETQAIGFALRDHAETLIGEAPTAEDYARTDCRG